MNQKLTFNPERFSELSLARCDGPFQCKDKDLKYWILAMTEELGEIAGALKKLERGFNNRELDKLQKAYLNCLSPQDDPIDMPSPEDFEKGWRKEKLKALGDEAADLFTYLDLFAQKAGFNLWEHVGKKFNQVSKEMNCEEFKIELTNL